VFERFTDKARRVVVLAQEEARRLGHNAIGSEHLLLGLICEGEGAAGQTLAALGIELDPARAAVERIEGRGTGKPSGHIPFTPGAKRVLEAALREALRFGHSYIGTEHVLLGVLHEEDGVAAETLGALGTDGPTVRRRLDETMAQTGPPPRPGTERATVSPPGGLALSGELAAVLGEAFAVAQARGEPMARPVHLFLAAVERPDGAAGDMLREVGVDPQDIRARLAGTDAPDEPDEPRDAGGPDEPDEPGEPTG
jgi:ATP-dependent Clp protease ATP-binding subunit ClpA